MLWQKNESYNFNSWKLNVFPIWNASWHHQQIIAIQSPDDWNRLAYANLISKKRQILQFEMSIINFLKCKKHSLFPTFTFAASHYCAATIAQAPAVNSLFLELMGEAFSTNDFHTVEMVWQPSTSIANYITVGSWWKQEQTLISLIAACINMWPISTEMIVLTCFTYHKTCENGVEKSACLMWNT